MAFDAYVIIIFTEKEAALRSLTTLPSLERDLRRVPDLLCSPSMDLLTYFTTLKHVLRPHGQSRHQDQEGNLPSRAARSRACTLRRRGAKLVADFPDEEDLRPNEANTRNIGPPQSIKSAIFVG